MNSDTDWMGAPLALASRSRGRTAPNPNVGCVIVRDGRVVGRGWTQPGGRPHAEAMALAQAGAAARGATLYTTLEPCAHISVRGPACADLIIESGVIRVVAALGDPDERTNGAGFDRLRACGLAVTRGIAADQAARSMAGFLTRQRWGRPHVTLKLAMALDGSLALSDGRSQWITGDAARAHGHGERARVETIIVGRGTFDADSPRLDVRLPGLEPRSPARAVLTTGPVPDGWIGLVSPEAITSLPGDHLLIEGGGGTAAAFLRADLVDSLLIYRAPILMGGLSLGDLGLTDLAQAHDRWHAVDSRMVGSDRLDVYDRSRS